jgi:hypothetical protein
MNYPMNAIETFTLINPETALDEIGVYKSENRLINARGRV